MDNRTINTRSKKQNINIVPIKKRKINDNESENIVDYENYDSEEEYDSEDLSFINDKELNYSSEDISYSYTDDTDDTDDTDVLYDNYILKNNHHRMMNKSKKYCNCNICKDCRKNNSNNSNNSNNCTKCKQCDICQIPNGLQIYKNMMHDDYFKNLNENDKLKYTIQQSELEEYNKQIIPVKYKILDSDISIKNKSTIMDKINEISELSPEASEYGKLKRWIDGISKVPFGQYANLPISLLSSDDEKYNFLCNINESLNISIYGQNSAKNKILQIVSQWISNPQSYGNVIALEGPPGIGKTTLIKNGLSNALNIPFCFVTLGGSSDASVLEGHSFTYEGSTWGKIVDMLMQSKCMNPIIFFDELDKISMSDKGKEITGILTHLTDSSQNDQFHDVYFSGIDFDIKRSLMIFSYNDINNIDPILRDRITCIKLQGFNINDKINIARDYLIPSIVKNIGLKDDDVYISDSNLGYIIKNYTNEEGVRKLRESLETIYNKINLLRFIKNGKDIEIDYSINKFKLPVKLTDVIIKKLLKA